MERYLFTLLLCGINLFSFARSVGYYYFEEFVELIPQDDFLYISTATGADELIEKIYLTDPQLAENCITRISENAFIVIGNKYSPIGDEYISECYKTHSGHVIVVLPSIYMELKEDTDISGILEQFRGTLKLLEKKGKLCSFICFAHSSSEVLDISCAINQMKDVLWCEPEKYIDVKPDNSLYGYQYYLKNMGQTGGTVGMDINVENAWSITSGNSNIAVAVIDDGVDNDHEDLQNCVLSGYTCGNPAGYGMPQNPNTTIKKAHGMACAGIIAANDNTIGIKGVASGVSVLPINIFPNLSTPINGFGSATDTQVAAAILWAYPNADVLNCSWSGSPSAQITSAINQARQYGRSGKGCVVVASAGNNKKNGTTDVAFPAIVDGVVSVGALDKDGIVTDYSQGGQHLSLVAFGGKLNESIYEVGDIYTLDRMSPLGEYTTSNYNPHFDGTSAACPQVAGVAALMLSANPDLTESQVKTILCSTANHMGASVPNDTCGYGLVDAYEAVKEAIVHNAVFYAPTLLTGTNTYSISGLPTGATIVWSATSGMTISSVSTDTYSCTITCPSNPPSVFGVTAKVYYNGVEIKSFSKTVFTYFNGSYRQDACGYYGVNHPAISTRPLPTNTATYVHMGCDVHVLGGYCFQNATITHSGITPGSWYFNGNSQLTFSLPYGSSGMPFHIYINGDATTGTHLLFFPVSGNGNLTSSLQVQTSGAGYELTLIRQESEQWTGERGDMEWDVEVYDTLRGALMHRAHVKGDSYRLDTSAWRAGTYVVRAVTGDDEEPLVEKIQVK